MVQNMGDIVRKMVSLACGILVKFSCEDQQKKSGKTQRFVLKICRLKTATGLIKQSY
jgi:hypothetical protein